MSGNYVARLTNEDRVRKSEGTDAPGNLRDLAIAMGAGISRIRHGPFDRPVLDLQLWLADKAGVLFRQNVHSALHGVPPRLGNFAGGVFVRLRVASTMGGEIERCNF